jgi:hypothetical protein
MQLVHRWSSEMSFVTQPLARLMISGALTTAILLLVAGCGGSSTTPAGVQATADGKFFLKVLDESMYDGGQFELQVEERAEAVEVSIVGHRVADLRGLYFDLEFDQAQFDPVAATASSALAASGEVLELGVISTAGRVTHGQVLANWNRRAGFSGDGVLATVRFEDGPQAEVRQASGVPVSDLAIAPASALAGPIYAGAELLVTVDYTNPGDYDQNGEVGISDLTPLGLHFGEVGPFEGSPALFGFSTYPVQTVIDGDGNGEINLADITQIGANFGNDVLGGYNFYISADIGDKPVGNSDPSTITPLASSAFGTTIISGDPTSERLRYAYAYPVVPPGEVHFWARPVDLEGDEGTPSETATLAVDAGLFLDLDSPSLGGSGTEEDPYEVEATSDHQLKLTHAVDGDVTTSSDTSYFFFGIAAAIGGLGSGELIIRERGALRELSDVTIPGLGSLDDETGVMELVDVFEGAFIVFATYGGRIANYLHCVVPDPDNLGPLAEFTVSSTTGTVPWTAEFDASPSDDTDGDIAEYAWDVGDDNTYEESNPGPLFNLELTEGGATTVKLRVTDDDGAMGFKTITLQTTGWQRTVLDEVSETSPADPMIQTIDGNPAVAYRQFNTLKYIRAADATGNSWNDSVSVPLSVTAQHICLRDLDGRPAMAYQRSGVEAGIYYVLGDTANATSFEQVRITSGAEDHSPTLNIIDGNPALAYAWYTGDPDPYTLLYIRSSDNLGNTGGAWDLITAGYVVDGETFLLDKTALQITDADLPGTDGRPCLMYIADNDEFGVPWRMCFSKATSASAFSWSLPITISSNGGSEISHPSVTSIVSRPRIAYFNPGAESVTYNATPNLNGFNWMGALDLPLGAEPGRGYFASLANVAGFCGMAYYDAGDDCIRYIATDDPEGDTGWAGNDYVSAAGEYDTSGQLNAYISLGAALGQPVIVYHDVANAELVYSTYYEAP